MCAEPIKRAEAQQGAEQVQTEVNRGVKGLERDQVTEAKEGSECEQQSDDYKRVTTCLKEA